MPSKVKNTSKIKKSGYSGVNVYFLSRQCLPKVNSTNYLYLTYFISYISMSTGKNFQLLSISHTLQDHSTITSCQDEQQVLLFILRKD